MESDFEKSKKIFKEKLEAFLLKFNGVIDFYDDFASIYDEFSKEMGIYHLSLFANALIELHINKSAEIADIGAGTGLLAEHLQMHGFTNITGFEASQNMLDIMKNKKVYSDTCKFILEKDEIPEKFIEKFDVVVACALLIEKQVSAKGIEELVKFCKKGGFVAFNFRDDEDEKCGFWDKTKEIEDQGKFKIYKIHRYNLLEKVGQVQNEYLILVKKL